MPPKKNSFENEASYLEELLEKWENPSTLTDADIIYLNELFKKALEPPEKA